LCELSAQVNLFVVSNREGESVTGKCVDPYIYSIWSAKGSTLGQTYNHKYKEKESQTSDRDMVWARKAEETHCPT